MPITRERGRRKTWDGDEVRVRVGHGDRDVNRTCDRHRARPGSARRPRAGATRPRPVRFAVPHRRALHVRPKARDVSPSRQRGLLEVRHLQGERFVHLSRWALRGHERRGVPRSRAVQRSRPLQVQRTPSDAECQASSICRRFGRCTMQGMACNVASNEDCARAEACTKNGQCSKVAREAADGVVVLCSAASNDDCAKGEDCTSNKLCTAIDGACR